MAKKQPTTKPTTAKAASNPCTDHFKQVIKAYLDKRASQDELFAATYAKKGKSIDECCRYIIQEVRQANRIGFSNAEVFGLAVHYYDEDDIKVSATTPQVDIVSTGHDDTPLHAPAPKATPKPITPQKKPTTTPKSATPKAATSKPTTDKPQYAASLFDLWQGTED
jgi:cell division septation protein DedD